MHLQIMPIPSCTSLIVFVCEFINLLPFFWFTLLDLPCTHIHTKAKMITKPRVFVDQGKEKTPTTARKIIALLLTKSSSRRGLFPLKNLKLIKL